MMVLQSLLRQPMHGYALVQQIKRSSNDLLQIEEGSTKEPRVIVESEDQPDRVLLETKICKEDGFQKQQGTYFARNQRATCGRGLTWANI